jgi:hypothetical protein
VTLEQVPQDAGGISTAGGVAAEPPTLVEVLPPLTALPGDRPDGSEPVALARQHRQPVPAGRVALAVHLASLGAALVVLLVVDRHMWFRGDDFDFLAQRGLHGAALSIWAPHNVHWSTLPILLWRAIFHFSALRDARPYLVALYVAHLLLAHVLWRAMRSAGCDLVVATALAGVFALLGSGGENILWAFQIGFVGSLLLGWTYLLLVNHEDGPWWRDGLAVVVGIASLMTSGVAVTMVMVGGLVAFGRRGWRAAATVVGPCAATYLVWFALVGHHARSGQPSLQSTLLAVPQYAFTGLEHSLAAATGSEGFGPVLYLALVLWALRRHRYSRSPAAPALMGVAGALVFFVITALGRDGAGPGAADQSRYVYVAVALLLPGIGLAMSELVRRGWGWGSRLAVVGVLALVGVWNFNQLLYYRNILTSGSLRTERQLVAASVVAAEGPTLPGALPIDNLRAPNISLPVLEALARQGALPAGVRPGPVDTVDAATQLQVGLTSRALYPTVGVGLTAPAAGFRRLVAGGGCTVATALAQGAAGAAGLSVSVTTPSSVLVTPPAGVKGSIELALVLSGVRGTPEVLYLGWRPAWLDIAASPATVELFSLAAGTSVRACT